MTPNHAEHRDLDHRTKGIPGTAKPFPAAAIEAKKWNVLRQNVPLPLAILHETAIDNNARWMREFCAAAGVSLAPHGKTTMCPQLFRRQLDDGAWAITLSTSHQVQVARDFGIERILVANQIVDPCFLDYVMAELDCDPAFDLVCLVDSVEGVRFAGERIKANGHRRRLGMLIEIGAAQGRTGVRSIRQAEKIATAAKGYTAQIELRGVEAFEGIFGAATEGNVEKVSALMDQMAQAARVLDAAGFFEGDEIILSAGGSAYYDIVADRLMPLALSLPKRIVMRSGCYIAHDAAMYRDYFASLKARSERVRSVPGALKPALQVMTYVQSMPEKGLALLTGGKRDLSFDAHLPVPCKFFRPGRHSSPVDIGGSHEIFALADQHAFLRTPDDTPLRIGDMVILDISHPCTTFDKWNVVYGVNDNYDITTAYRTYF
ncbi:MAG: amino acid deaminase [Rhizobiales bacterium]|nr:amino acid deaminase [Hyphomicrobiales bacterium]